MKGLLISDFNLDGFKRYLENDGEAPALQVETAPYDQVVPTLLGHHAEFDFALIWTLPQNTVPAFKRVLEFERVPSGDLMVEVDLFAKLVADFAGRSTAPIFIPSWTVPTSHRGNGLLDLRPGTGIAHALLQMNLRLSESLERLPNVFVLNTQRWVELSGTGAFSPKFWYMGKIAFGNEVFKEALRDVKAGLRGIRGQARKLIVVDLDNTLWGGIVGDQGWQNLELGGHDLAGEAFVDFQRALKSFKNRGILLAIVSKNEESIALEAIEKHPEMILRKTDFAGWRINWHDKAQNLLELVSELNLGLQSVVFLDDSPSERQRVRDALPEVCVPELPVDHAFYRSIVLSLRDFDSSTLTQEDLGRNEMAQAERQRQEIKRKLDDVSDAASVDKWIASLEIKIEVENLNATNLARAAQLLNKTNQMNLATRRLTEPELLKWAAQPQNQLFTFRINDKFGDSGLTGLLGLAFDGENAEVADLVLSCRVMGRQVERSIVAFACAHAKGLGAKRLRFRYLATAKNMPCLEFLNASGLKIEKAGSIYSWNTDQNYPQPGSIALSFAKNRADSAD